jgi:hypothetical protein
MKTYISKSGKASGVTAYEAGADYIIVAFTDGHRYKYTYSSAGETHIETMKRLAKDQAGLSTYISRHQPGYEQRF